MKLITSYVLACCMAFSMFAGGDVDLIKLSDNVSYTRADITAIHGKLKTLWQNGNNGTFTSTPLNANQSYLALLSLYIATKGCNKCSERAHILNPLELTDEAGTLSPKVRAITARALVLAKPEIFSMLPDFTIIPLLELIPAENAPR